MFALTSKVHAMITIQGNVTILAINLTSRPGIRKILPWNLSSRSTRTMLDLKIGLRSRKLRRIRGISRERTIMKPKGRMTRRLTINEPKIGTKIVKSSTTTSWIAISTSTSIVVLIKPTLKHHSHMLGHM